MAELQKWVELARSLQDKAKIHVSSVTLADRVIELEAPLKEKENRCQGASKSAAEMTRHTNEDLKILG